LDFGTVDWATGREPDLVSTIISKLQTPVLGLSQKYQQVKQKKTKQYQ